MVRESLQQQIIRILSNYKVHSSVCYVTDEVLFEDEFGMLRMRADRILRGARISSRSAVDRHAYLLNMIHKHHPDFCILDDFNATNDSVRFTYSGRTYRNYISNLIKPDFKIYRTHQFAERHQEYRERIEKMWGKQYDLSLVQIGKVDDKVHVICRKHGDFYTRLGQLLSGHGCKKCAAELLSSTKALRTDGFIAQAKAKYGDKYDYAKTHLCGRRSWITVTCPLHGDFRRNATAFLQGAECPICKKSQDISTLYLIYDPVNRLSKIGKCKGHPNGRIGRIRLSADKEHRGDLQLITYWEKASEYEHFLHKRFAAYKCWHPYYKCGATEWFLFDQTPQQIAEQISSIIKQIQQHESH